MSHVAGLGPILDVVDVSKVGAGPGTVPRPTGAPIAVMALRAGLAHPGQVQVELGTVDAERGVVGAELLRASGGTRR